MNIESQDLRFRDHKNNQSLQKLQILVFGDGQTGKSSLVNILTYRKYPDKMTRKKQKQPFKTQGCDIRMALRNDLTQKQQYLLQILDISGDKAQRQYLDVYISRLKLDGIIFCFDVTNLKTLDNLRKWIQRLSVKSVIHEVNEEVLETNNSEFAKQSCIAIQDEQDSLLNYNSYNGIPMDEILQTPFIFIGCKMDQIPMDKQVRLRQQICERIQQIYKRSSTVILLSTTKPETYSDQYKQLEECIMRIKQRDKLEEFQIREKIQQKMMKLDESFCKSTKKILFEQKYQLFCVYMKHFCQRLMCKKRKQ
ncbi:unnamed protein product [Paramecium pentaurelia]|uniref:Uncharacterized protein n=1 Tax=Paramecium pentaurelia TaxID=43138 RepID=A0A8S1VGF0_9CILI|nr:unnamed protein product [Paramecium pentaurelia]